LLSCPAPSSLDVTADGRRFLVISTEGEQVGSEPITLVVNWSADLHR